MSERRARRARALAYLEQPYVVRLNQAIDEGAMRPGSVGIVAIYHDDCPKLRGWVVSVPGKC